MLACALLLCVADATRRYGMMDSFREVKPQAVLDALPAAHYVTQPKVSAHITDALQQHDT